MFPYILLLVSIMSVVLLESFFFRRKAFWLPLIIFVFFASIRSLSVGTDTINYTYNFERPIDLRYYNFNQGVEWGYQFLEYTLLKFTNNYFWLFFVSSTIVVSSYLITFKRLSVNYLYSILIFITFGFYTFFFNGLRQGIAMAICFLGLNLLIEGRLIPYFLIVFIASMFHISALVMLPMYLLVNTNLKMEYKITICFIISIFTSKFLIDYLAKGNSRYEHYTLVAEQAGGYFTLFFYAIIGLILYFLAKKNRIEDVRLNKIEQLFLCGLALVIPLSLLGTDPSGPQRILFYFASMVVFLIPFILKKINNLYIDFIFFIFSTIYFVLITTRFGGLYPYEINSIFEIF